MSLPATRADGARDAEPIATPAPRDALLVAGATLVGFILRVVHLGRDSLWLDEAYSLYVAGGSLRQALLGGLGDRHTPPLYYGILNLWLRLWGSDIGLRMLSVLFGVAAIPLIYLFGRRIFGRSAGLVAAWAAAVSAYAVYYSQEGRMYGLLLLLAAATSHLAWKMAREPRRSTAAAWGLLTLVSFYTHYYGVLLAGAQFLYVGWCAARERRGRGLTAAVAVCVAAGFVPWLRTVERLAESGGQSFRTFLLPQIPYTAFRWMAGYGILPLTPDLKARFAETLVGSAPLLAPFGLLFLALVVRAAVVWGRRPGAGYLALLLTLPAAAALLISLSAPVLSERYLIVSAPAFYVVVALGLCSADPASRPRAGLAALRVSAVLVAALALGAHYGNPKFGKTQWREAAGYVAGRCTPGDRIFYYADFIFVPFDHYFRARGAHADVAGVRLPPASAWSAGKGPPGEPRSGASGRVWLVLAHGGDPDFYESLFAQRFRLVEERVFPLENGLAVRLYETAGTSPSPGVSE